MKAKHLLFLFALFCFFFAACGKDDSYDASSLFYLDTFPDIDLFASNGMDNQSAAAYGDYLVLIPTGRSAIHLYNLRTKTFLCTYKMRAGTGKDAWGYDLYHSNQATFGADFYSNEDYFPLLYISQRAGSDKRCFTEVYRLIPQKGIDESDFSTLDAQLVQIIFFPALSHDNSLGNVNSVIDSHNKWIYTYSRNNNSGDDNAGDCKISQFHIPDIKKDTVTLEDKDIIDSFMLGCKAINMQGGSIHNGLLYIGQGYKSAGYIFLNIVDLKKRRLKERIDLLDHGISWEPEGCFIYDGNLMIASGADIWEFSFPRTRERNRRRILNP